MWLSLLVSLHHKAGVPRGGNVVLVFLFFHKKKLKTKWFSQKIGRNQEKQGSQQKGTKHFPL